MIKRWLPYVATLGPIGYLPASGTAATLVTLPVVWLLRTYLPYEFVYATLLVLVVFAGVWLANYTLAALSLKNDPSEIVIDEVAGCMITFFAIPISVKILIFGFVLFRLFDIFKPLGIARLQTIHGGWGIMIDDIAAGILSNVILHLLHRCM